MPASSPPVAQPRAAEQALVQLCGVALLCSHLGLQSELHQPQHHFHCPNRVPSTVAHRVVQRSAVHQYLKPDPRYRP